MAQRQFIWTDGLGVPFSSIRATVEDERVLVDNATLKDMARYVIGAHLFSDADAKATADGVLAVPANAAGLHDVTDLLGFKSWMDSEIIERPTA